MTWVLWGLAIVGIDAFALCLCAAGARADRGVERHERRSHLRLVR